MEAALLTKPWINHCVRPYGMEIEILGCSHIELIYASATAELDRKCVSDNRILHRRREVGGGQCGSALYDQSKVQNYASFVHVGQNRSEAE